MSASSLFQCRKLDASSLQSWFHLISPVLRTYVSAVQGSPGSEHNHLLALAMEGEASERAALLLAEVADWSGHEQTKDQRLCILTLVVAKPYRRLGLAGALLRHAEHWARSHQLSGLHLPVPLQANVSDVLRRLSPSDQGWVATPGKVVVGLSISPAVEALLQRLEDVVRRQSRHASWQIAPFPEQHTAQLQQRIVMASSGQLAAPWDPEADDYQWHPAAQYSCLLFHQGVIIGWLITHFVSPDCLRYAKFWVDSGWERSGAPLAMLAFVMRSAHFSGEPRVIPKGCFISHPTNLNLHHWVQKQFRPVCESWVQIENRDLVFLHS